MKFFSRAGVKADIVLMAALAVFSALLYFPFVADYAFPGESAQLAVVWRGLDVADYNPYPLLALFAKGSGAANLFAPFLGILAVAALYALARIFFTLRLVDEDSPAPARDLARIGGLATAVAFALTPAVREAATHFEPRLFDTLWALLAFLSICALLSPRRAAGFGGVVLAGILVGLGVADSLLFVYLLPLYAAFAWMLAGRREQNAGAALAAFLVPCALTAVVFVPCTVGDFTAFAQAQTARLRFDFAVRHTLAVPCFTILPALVALFASRRAFTAKPGPISWIFHVFMTLLAIIAYASPLAPFAVLRTYGVLPVAASAFAAFLAAYVFVYWMKQIASPLAVEPGVDEDARLARIARPLGLAVGGVFTLILAVALFFNIFLRFEGGRGRFADIAAAKIVSDLGPRTWFVTDGTLDDHLRLAAANAGKPLHLVCLQRDLDANYLARLGKAVKEADLLGPETDDLLISLKLGVWPFVQDWFAADTNVAQRAAIFGTPDLWLYAHKQPVPEFLFFGGDPARFGTFDDWAAYDKLLEAPKGWGSYSLVDVEDPVARKRLNLRRHLGLVANDRGFYLQNEKQDAQAFEMYDLVLNTIDRDNVSALFNELGLVDAGYPKAVAKKNELTKRMKTLVEDEKRRYRLEGLSIYYGYIRNAEVFARLGLSWARSGMPGEGLQQMRRAIDFIPDDNRVSVLNLLASLYASDSQQEKSREIYRDILAQDASNRDALLGLTRLELQAGNLKGAARYLEKAAAAGGDDVRVQLESALLKLMQNDTPGAKLVLRKVTEAHAEDMQAWSLLASTVMRQIDESKDAAERHALEAELEKDILPAMEKQARSADDYYLLTTRAFLMMRKNDEANRRAARDAFIAAAQSRPDLAGTRDIILGLDIQLNDTADAETQAKLVLKKNRRAPLANYVLGSLALRDGRYAEAEGFLRRSVDTEKPLPLALNDLAEVLRRDKRYDEAAQFARRATSVAPDFYVAWETLAAALLDGKGDLAEAEKAASKAVALSTDANGREMDVRMLITLARVQFAQGALKKARATALKVRRRMNELSPFEQQEFKDFMERVK